MVVDSIDLAIDQFKSAVKISPDYAEAFYWLGLAEITRDNASEGCLSLKNAAKLGYDEAEPLIEQHCR